MPITQDRMLSLLGAAQDYQNTMERLFALGQETRARVESKEISLEEGFNLLCLTVRPELMLQFPYESPMVIKTESIHFAQNYKRNRNKALKLRENRQAAQLGLPKPYRGDGREHGKRGGRTGGDRKQFLVAQPQVSRSTEIGKPSMEHTASTARISPVPSLHSTDHLQVAAESDLDFDLQPQTYTAAESEMDLLSRLEPEARAQIEAEIRLREQDEQAGKG